MHAPGDLPAFTCFNLKNGVCTVDPKWEAPCRLCPAHTPAGILAEAEERAIERRVANRLKCQHRAAESHRDEPCSCPVTAQVPIYHCGLLNVECADIQKPKDPATYCSHCPHHTRLRRESR